MKEKVKILKNRKVLIAIGILVICVVGIFAVASQKNNGKSGSESSKKNMLENYASEDKNSEENETVSYDDNYISKTGLSHIYVTEQNVTIKNLFKAAVDFAMENQQYDGWSNNVSYWQGVHKAVLRLRDDVYFKKDIVLTEYEGNDYYKVSEEVVNEIGQIMWENEIPKWNRLEAANIIFDKNESCYYFQKTEPVEYMLVSMKEESDNDNGEMEKASVSGVVSLDYASYYGVREFIFDIAYTNNNRVGFSLTNVSENGYKSDMSPFQSYSSSLSSVSEIVADSRIIMEKVVLPYTYFLRECENEKEAAWLAIYNVAYAYNSGEFDNSDNIISKTFGLYQPQEIVKVEDKEYMYISDLFIKDFAQIYLGQYNLKAKTIPDYLKELMTYDKSINKYCVQINKEYIKNIAGNYAYDSDDGRCEVFGLVGDKDNDEYFKYFGLRIEPSEYNNFRFAVINLM